LDFQGHHSYTKNDPIGTFLTYTAYH